MENTKYLAEQFIDKYKQLEMEIKRYYGKKAKEKGDTEIYYIEQRPEFDNYKNGLSWCREIRNLLSHNTKVANAYPIEPSPQMIDFLEEVILKVRNRKTCMQVGVPFTDMYCRTINDTVVDTIKEMRDKTYTYVPIVDGKK